MRAFISVSYDKWPTLYNELRAISNTLKQFNIEPHIFLDKYQFDKAEEKEMMLRAMKDIDESDLLIAEVSGKAIGIGIEAGYARGKGKLLIYMRNSTAEHSTTVSGISDFQVIYKNPTDLSTQLGEIIKSIR